MHYPFLPQTMDTRVCQLFRIFFFLEFSSEAVLVNTTAISGTFFKEHLCNH